MDEAIKELVKRLRDRREYQSRGHGEVVDVADGDCEDAADALEALAGEVENLRHDVARHMGIANAAEAERDELANWKASFLHENEQILASNAQLAAERDRLKAALEDIGKQPLITEMGDDDLDGAIEEGYDQCILTARKALGDAS
jgi:NAD(P)-dependent dehydrogenase (short-subunit alcohol dehydrogenase family)